MCLNTASFTAVCRRISDRAGLVISVIREDLITEDVLPGTPTMMQFKTYADTVPCTIRPNCYGIYICGKVFQWIMKMGGLEA